MSSLPAISASVATMPGKRWGTGTLAGQVSKSLPARLNRFFGRKSVLIPLFVLAAASVTAAFTVYPSRKTAPAKAAPPEAAAMPPAPAAAAPLATRLTKRALLGGGQASFEAALEWDEAEV